MSYTKARLGTVKNKAKYVINLYEDEQNSKESEPERGNWDNEIEFLLSCVGLSIGFGNVWRFPYLAYSSGGGAFLFPYIILLLIVGKPMYFLELALGQFCSLGPMTVWKCFPVATGVGVAMITVSLLVSIYYNVLVAYTLFFLWNSFSSQLPWSQCFEWWGANTETCYVRTNQSRCLNEMTSINQQEFLMIQTTTPFGNSTPDNISLVTNQQVQYKFQLMNCTNATQTAAEQFWRHYVLDISSGIEEMGTIKWDLAVCLLIAWCIIFLCLTKGVKSHGKVVYFTSTFPYVCMIAMLIYGLTLDGASIGLKYLFIPQWEKILDIKVWMAAAAQLFYSLGLSWGGLIMYGSYNYFNNKVHRYALFVSSLDFLTSIIAGTIIFSVLGQMAKQTGLNIEDVVQQDQGLAFVAYPEALTQLWLPQLWTFLFFFMFLLLGVNNEFALIETCTTALYDEFPKTRKYKPLIALCVCTFCFSAGLPCVMQGGAYVFHILEYYGGSFVLVFIAIFELIALMWGYGIRQLCSDFEMMLNIKMNYYFQASWLVASPLLLSFIFIYGMLNDKPITYDDKELPNWTIGVGWFLALLSMGQIPLWAIFILIKHRNNLQYAIFPTPDWGPADLVARKQWEKINNPNKELKIIGIDNFAMNVNESEI